MFIKVWNSHDCGVYQINKPAITAYCEKYLEGKFTAKQIKELKQIAREFTEELGLVFVHNLKAGWEQKVLSGGRVFVGYEKRELKSIKEIKATLSEKGKIEFTAHKKLGSYAFIKKLKKPAKERWPR